MNADITPIVRIFVRQGLTVCYVDFDSARRAIVGRLKGVTTMEPKLSGKGTLHTNVLILVNESEFDPKVAKELKNIPGYIDGVFPTTIRIDL